MITFDGSSREVCISRRIRTNTPLQALVTLNDPVFAEAARALAERMIRTEPDAPEKAIAAGYRFLTFKDLPEKKMSVLNNLYEQASATYEKDTAAIHAVTKNNQATEKLAAMTVVANALLNLDEVVMKE
jgi:hypothetical protein